MSFAANHVARAAARHARATTRGNDGAKHLAGIINAVVLKATNALGESMNAKIQKIKSQACGYRNRQSFRDAIMFHL